MFILMSGNCSGVGELSFEALCIKMTDSVGYIGKVCLCKVIIKICR